MRDLICDVINSTVQQLTASRWIRSCGWKKTNRKLL